MPAKAMRHQQTVDGNFRNNPLVIYATLKIYMSEHVGKVVWQEVVRSIAERLGGDIFPIFHIAHLRMGCAPFVANVFHGNGSNPASQAMAASSKWVPLALSNGLGDAKLQVFLSHGRRVHKELGISTEHLEYVLAVLVLSFHGWILENTTMKLSEDEIQSLLTFFGELGRVMEIPTNCSSLEDFELKCAEFEPCFPRFEANRQALAQDGIQFVRGSSSFQYRLIALFLYRISVPASVCKLMKIYRPNRMFASVIRSLFRVRWHLADLWLGLRRLGSRQKRRYEPS